MSQLPPEPPTLDSPELIDQAAAATEFQRVLLPWADLNAQSPPASFMQLGKDLLPVLAVLAGMGPDQPHLLTTDALARLVTATSLSNADPILAPALNATNLVRPATPHLFPPGTSFYLGPADGNGAASLSGPYLVLRNDAGVVTCLPVITGDYAIGDIMLAVPTIASASAVAPSGGGGSGFRTATVLPFINRASGDYTVDLPMGAAKGMLLYYFNAGPSNVNLAGVFRIGPAHALNQQVIQGPSVGPGGGYIVKIYPGLINALNDTANDVLGQTARITLNVEIGAGNNATFDAFADLLP